MKISWCIIYTYAFTRTLFMDTDPNNATQFESISFLFLENFRMQRGIFKVFLVAHHHHHPFSQEK